MSSIWNGIKKAGSGIVTAGRIAVRVSRSGVLFYTMYAAMGLNPYTIAVPLITFIV